MKRFHQFITVVLLACLSAVNTACSMMEEDRSDCPTGLYVNFVYDYNTQRADMFKDHVGYVTVYVFDESGNKVAERSVSNSATSQPLADYGYTMHFTTDELPAGHNYLLKAVAMQKNWDDALSSTGAKYRRSSVTSDQSLVVTLDHDATAYNGTADGPHAVDNSAPLDTLWHTLKVMPMEPTYGYDAPNPQSTTKPYSVYPAEEQMVTVQEGYATYATISLIRDTKHLNITLRQIDDPADINADDYEVTIVDDNSVLASDNSIAEGDSLIYTPYAQWTSLYDGNSISVEGDIHPATRATVQERTAHYNLMFNRLMYNENFNEAAKLCIRNKKDGCVVTNINLSTFLAECRISPEWSYSAQEYLDREYDYELNFFLKGDKWQYCDIQIHTLAWTKRKQNVEL